MKNIILALLFISLISCEEADPYRGYHHTVADDIEIYDPEEIYALKPGDTIYLEYGWSHTFAIVEKNDTAHRFLILQRANIYDAVLFSKEVWPYKKLP